MSDKTMHVMAYFVLTFLVWFAISPYEKVHWNKAKCWLVVLAVVLYGVMDEYLQSKVGRSADVKDFIANLFGVLLGLGVLSIFGFWSALLTVSAVFIFVLSDVSRLMTLPQYSFYAIAFHFTAYTAFTLIWIQWLDRFSKYALGKAGGLAVAVTIPAGLLLAVKGAAPFWDRPFNAFELGIAVFGICAAILTSYLTIYFSRKT
ncbi:MAG: VanZ family protein [Planctomycetota bacterium]|jgi:4-amino-4-deoxy-L-arabinose transferase-like glycosyltransferase